MLKQQIKKLETLINKLESPQADLDDAFELHAKGLELIEEFNEAIAKARQKGASAQRKGSSI